MIAEKVCSPYRGGELEVIENEGEESLKVEYREIVSF